MSSRRSNMFSARPCLKRRQHNSGRKIGNFSLSS